MPSDLEHRLTSAVTAYDRRASRRPQYNVFALAQYLQAVDRVVIATQAGVPVAKAIEDNFVGVLRTVALRAMSDPARGRPNANSSAADTSRQLHLV